ncbi:MAG: hypothetical protein ACYCV7_00315 [Acidimicrobiales bacterium]
MVRLKELDRIARSHADKFRSDDMTAFVRTLKRERDDEYSRLIGYHPKLHRLRGGELMNAALDKDNSGIGATVDEL